MFTVTQQEIFCRDPFVPHGLPYSAKVGKQLCEDYQSPITANVSASAPLNVIMSIGKHIGSVY